MTITTPSIGSVDWAPAHEADGLDRHLSALLDIQDDIALAVIWLAENWSADLPAPGWTGTGSDLQDQPGPALRLPVYCSAAELDRIAALLDVEPVDDPTPNSHGRRYRRARRVFGTGRVLLEAFHTIDDGEPAR